MTAGGTWCMGWRCEVPFPGGACWGLMLTVKTEKRMATAAALGVRGAGRRSMRGDGGRPAARGLMPGPSRQTGPRAVALRHLSSHPRLRGGGGGGWRLAFVVQAHI